MYCCWIWFLGMLKWKLDLFTMIVVPLFTKVLLYRLQLFLMKNECINFGISVLESCAWTQMKIVAWVFFILSLMLPISFIFIIWNTFLCIDVCTLGKCSDERDWFMDGIPYISGSFVDGWNTLCFKNFCSISFYGVNFETDNPSQLSTEDLQCALRL